MIIKPLKISLLLLGFFLVQHKSSDAQTLDWVKQFENTGSVAMAMASDTAGNIYITGEFHNTVDFDPGVGVFNLTSVNGTLDVYVTKLDPSGNLLWAVGIGGNLDDIPYGLTLDDSANVYITGRFGGTVDFDPGLDSFILNASGYDAFILKLTSNGEFSWVKYFPSPSFRESQGRSVCFSSDGYLYATGYFTETADFEPDNGGLILNTGAWWIMNTYVAKFQANGSLLWVKQFETTTADGPNFPKSIAISPQDNLHIGGYFQGTVDFDPGATSFPLTATASSIDGFVVKLNSDGDFVWAKSFEGNYNMDLLDVAIDMQGAVYTTGQASDVIDFDPGSGTYFLSQSGNFPIGGTGVFISKLDANGDFVWAHGFEGNIGTAVSVDNQGNAFLTGDVLGTDGRFFISKIDAFGDVNWMISFAGNTYSYDIHVDVFGNIYSCGTFTGTADFDPSSGMFNLTSSGSNTFIHKFHPGALSVLSANSNQLRTVVYPNPTQQELNLSVNSHATEKATMSITDLTGKTVLEKEIRLLSGDNLLHIDVENLPRGSYIITLISTGGKSVCKFVKL
jgi:hypothetical protein